MGIFPLSSMPSLDEGQSEAQAELTREVWDLNDDQMWEVLEALQTKMAQRGACSPTGSPQGNPRVPGGSSEFVTDDGEVEPRRERGWT